LVGSDGWEKGLHGGLVRMDAPRTEKTAVTFNINVRDPFPLPADPIWTSRPEWI